MFKCFRRCWSSISLLNGRTDGDRPRKEFLWHIKFQNVNCDPAFKARKQTIILEKTIFWQVKLSNLTWRPTLKARRQTKIGLLKASRITKCEVSLNILDQT